MLKLPRLAKHLRPALYTDVKNNYKVKFTMIFIRL